MSSVCCVQSDILSSLAHWCTYIHIHMQWEKSGIASNVPGCECVCVDGLRRMEHGFYFREERDRASEREHIM